MRIMCVDNSKRDLHRIMKCCLKAPQVGFTTEKEALMWLRDHPCDIAFMETLKAESTVDSKSDNEEKKTLCVFSRLVIRQTCSMGLRSGE